MSLKKDKQGNLSFQTQVRKIFFLGAGTKGNQTRQTIRHQLQLLHGFEQKQREAQAFLFPVTEK